MDERTRTYLAGRFRDHYRRTAVEPPPGADRREWGFVPWTGGDGITMVRHRSLLDLGDLDGFLARRSPRHVYYSAGYYDEPDAPTMDAKGWRRADLVFDLDADHLPGVDPGADSYAEMLAACKDALLRLLDLLETDFGFEDLSVVFSGNRGYHVHVRDEGVVDLGRRARREIADYVRGAGVALDALVAEEAVTGSAGRTTPAGKRVLPADGGWAARAREHLRSAVEDLRAADEDDARERLQAYDGIGPAKAEKALSAVHDRYDEVAAGNVDVHGAFYDVARRLVEEATAEAAAPIDEPVTTDVNRLIRLPRSLHGASGLVVRPVARDEVADFSPLDDAVPETFTRHEISVEVTDGGPVDVVGEGFTVEEGDTSLPEYAGVFLMARGRAEKGDE